MNWESYYQDMPVSQLGLIPESFVVRYFQSKRPVVFKHSYKFIGKKILDAGCGHGRHIPYFESLGLQVYGFDISEELIVNQQKLFKNAELSKGSFDQPPFDENFDFCVSINSIYYCDNESAIISRIKLLLNKLQTPGYGLISFCMPNHFVLGEKVCEGDMFDVYVSLEKYHQCGQPLKIVVPKNIQVFTSQKFQDLIGARVEFSGQLSDVIGNFNRSLAYVGFTKSL